MSQPDMTVLWQRYEVSSRQAPDDLAPTSTPPGLYRDNFGNTWLKSGDGSICQLGEDLAPSEPPPIETVVTIIEGTKSGTHIQKVAIPNGAMVAKISIYNTVGWKQIGAVLQVGTPSDRARWYSGDLPQAEGQIAVVWPYEEVTDNQELNVQVQTVATTGPTGITTLSMQTTINPTVLTLQAG